MTATEHMGGSARALAGAAEGKYGYDRCYGWGRVDAYRAVINQQARDRQDPMTEECGL